MGLFDFLFDNADDIQEVVGYAADWANKRSQKNYQKQYQTTYYQEEKQSSWWPF